MPPRHRRTVAITTAIALVTALALATAATTASAHAQAAADRQAHVDPSGAPLHPSPHHAQPDGLAAAHPTSASSKAPLHTPQQAYERALALLRSTIKSKPKPGRTSSTKKQPADESAQAPPTSPRQKHTTSQHDGRTTAATPRISAWDIILGWTPIGTIYRLLLVLADTLGLRSPYPAAADTALSLSNARSSFRTAEANLKWLGPPIGATRDELRWQGARPIALWPDWESLGPGAVPLNSEDSPWDSVMFGPFHAGWESEDGDEGAAPFLQDVSLEHLGQAVRPARSLLQHPAIPSAIRQRLEAKPDGRGSAWWPRVEAPWSQAKRQRRESLKADMERRRTEAIELLEWAAWGRNGIDWQHEAYSADSTADVLADLFGQASGQNAETDAGTAAAPTPPRLQAHADALWVLAEHSLWGTHGALPNIARARACYQRLVDLGRDADGHSRAGNASAHARLAFLEGSGWESTVRRQWLPPPASELATLESSMDERELRDLWQHRREAFARLKRDDGLRQAKALIHYRQAAEDGDAPSQMALGFRYRAGIGAKPTCTVALKWYERAAQEAYRRFQTGPPGGLTVPYSKLRLSDLAGGAYGPGASAASTGWAALKPAVQAALNRQPGTASDPQGLEDMLEYHIYHAERGDARFMLLLARVYYQGSIWAPSDAAGAVRRDYKKSMGYLLRITRRVWPKDAALVGRGGPTGWVARQGDKGEDVQLKVDDQTLLPQAGSAASLIGRMYLRGEGVRQDFARAWVWLNRGADTGDGDAYSGLGVMLRDGLGVDVDVGQAVQFFEAAAKERSVEGTINLAKVHIDLEDYPAAIKYLELAIRSSNSFEAYYLMATVNAHLARTQNSPDRCRLAVAGFKQAVERGDWAAPIFHKAERAWRRGNKHKALLGWAMAGEMGYEAAQNNVAYILDRDKRRLRLPLLDARTPSATEDNSTDRLALIHWTRSAGQDNVDAMVKMGDYYFHGIGTRNPGRAAYDKAAACYSAAADRQVSALAYWNMGWLHEEGLGVVRQDFHLAKRYYDMAVGVNDEAYLPVTLSLIKLHLRALWAAVWRSDASESALSLFSSYASPTSPDDAAYTEADEVAQRNRRRLEDERRRGGVGHGHGHGIGEEGAGMGPDDDLGIDAGDGLGDPNEPETWHSTRRTEFGGGDEADDEEIEELIEGGLVVLALGVLAYLAYVRQGVQLRIERERRQQAQAALWQDGGGGGEQRRDEEGEGRRGMQPFPWAPEGGGAGHAAGL
ncbi:related to Sel-1 homolog precursor [Pseudozyma flocculosa]|uniref:Related to Sel-1 homolog n=1 Tax=Pseudozyma flocculosa TaxID=84751 RepID=A0A5C3F958_9BASI|nr:related to Sel-1 homolog precursor [Pseudozyma flocculosa]